MKLHPMILTQAFDEGGILLNTETLTLACWKDATPHSLFVQAQEPPAPETMKAFHQALVGHKYQGAVPLFITTAQPVTAKETVVFYGQDHIAAHHLPSSLTLLFGGCDDLPPLIRKIKWEAYRSQIPEITLDLVAEMNEALGRTYKDGLPVAPFMVAPCLIG